MTNHTIGLYLACEQMMIGIKQFKMKKWAPSEPNKPINELCIELDNSNYKIWIEVIQLSNG
jgi:hypothetical protein